MGYQGQIRTNVVLDVTERIRETAILPITLEEAKEYLKMTGIDDDDTVINRFIAEAVDWLETYCDISAVPQTVTAYVQVKNKLYLPCGPVTELVSIDPNTPAILRPDKGFPALYGYGIYTISYKAGYDPLPDALLGALYSYIAYAYEHRGDDALEKAEIPYLSQAAAKAFPFVRSIIF